MKFGTKQFLDVTRKRWDSRRIELEYLLAELKAGRALAVLAPLVVNADIDRMMLEESLGAGRNTETYLKALLKKSTTSADPTERATIEIILEEISMCNAIFKVLKNRIREGKIFGPDETPNERRKTEMQKKWKTWLRTTEARRRTPQPPDDK